jgi:hypothetical protein
MRGLTRKSSLTPLLKKEINILPISGMIVTAKNHNGMARFTKKDLTVRNVDFQLPPPENNPG